MSEKKHCDFGPVFWIHLLYIALIYTSPLWLNWKIMPLAIGVVYFQWFFFGGCVLTIWEFGRTEHNSFYWYYLNRLGFKFSLKKVNLFTDYLAPSLIFIFAFTWQFIFGHAAWL